MDNKKLLSEAKKVLAQNSRGNYTVPSNSLYPHQWLWDSCFIAIGKSHYDLKKAKLELISLKRGQWQNGMMPNIIFSDEKLNFDDEIWHSKSNRFAPKDANTSGITQPPILADAVLKVGEKMPASERKTFYQEMIGCIVKFHQWMYLERDPNETGLISLIHPYESGLDNSPTWLEAVSRLRFPWWIRAVRVKNFNKFINFFRRDTRRVAESQRISLADAAEYFYILQRLKNCKYDSKKIIKKSKPVVEDLVFNSLLIHSNKSLKKIAAEIDYKLPRHLLDQIRKTEHSLEQLWDDEQKQYFSRNYRSQNLIKSRTIASLLPLYSGSVTRTRASELVSQLKDYSSYNCHFPIPSVPLNSNKFNASNFWQGPTWVNTNWLIIQGLRNYGFNAEARDLTEKTISMVKQAGFNEYFSPYDGHGKGAKNFSWTASLTIDLLNN